MMIHYSAIKALILENHSLLTMVYN
jgi:hypothetical protein